MFAVFSNKDLALLGRLLLNRHPQVAQDLLSDFRSTTIEPKETDLSRLPTFFAHFCILRNVPSPLLAHAKYNRDLVDTKRLFVGAILSLYHPSAIGSPELLNRQQTGLVGALADVLQTSQAAVSKLVHAAISNYKVYDSFRSEVVELTHKLHSYGKDSQPKDN